MKKLVTIAILSILFASFTTDKDGFAGKIIYKYSFTDLKGNDISDKVAPFLGREQHYYIDGKNYKAYDEKNNWMQLYNSATNKYYYFNKDKTAQQFDGAMVTSQKFEVTKLNKTEKVAGYDCQAIQVETNDATTIYYFSPAVKIDYKTFSKHSFGEWNKYLEATQGALSLKFIMTDHKNGYIWTSVAKEVTKQSFTSKDFEFPKGVTIKN